MDTADTAGELDPRIQIELESLNSATDEINKLEIELEEANSTFRILLNESTRRLKLLSKKLGTCIDKSRGFHEARDALREAQANCQSATFKFRRANEIYVAAKETVALAEQQFMTNSHEWQFDNAWQEMLNHATIKVMTAEQQKTECHAEHYRAAEIFNSAEQKVSHLEDRFRRNIRKSQPYFETKQICQDQLNAQKQRIQELQQLTKQAKARYAGALRNLELISEDIHRKRTESSAEMAEEAAGSQPTPAPMSPPPPVGRREPGVGADEQSTASVSASSHSPAFSYSKFSISTLDVNAELDRCCGVSPVASNEDTASTGSSASSAGLLSRAASLINVSLSRSNSTCSTPRQPRSSSSSIAAATSELDLERLRHRVKELAVRPVEGGDGQPAHDSGWETELNETVNQLDRLMMMRETGMRCLRQMSSPAAAVAKAAAPAQPAKTEAEAEAEASKTESGGEVPLLQRWSNEIAQRTKRFQLGRRSSLE